MAWTTIFFLLCLVWLVSNFYSLLRNYLAARKLGVPIYVLPWNTHNPIWMILSVPVRPYAEKYLPASWYAAVRLAVYGFEFRSKETLFAADSDLFVLVTAGPIVLTLRDP